MAVLRGRLPFAETESIGYGNGDLCLLHGQMLD